MEGLWYPIIKGEMAILDFSTAFHAVPRNKLLYKLKYYGVKGNTLKWLSSLLKREKSTYGGGWETLVFHNEQYLDHCNFSYA